MSRAAPAHTALALWLALASVGAEATEIYRCDLNGVKTFVDSPNRCAGGQAERLGADKVAPKPVEPRAQKVERVTPRPAAMLDPLVPPVAIGPAALPAINSVCQKISVQDTPKLRECLREERRNEVRRIATPRLAGVSRAFAEYVSMSTKVDGVLAIGKDGRPPAWCEDVIGDVIALNNIDVVDDEETVGPRWIESVAPDGGRSQRAADILDPGFQEWSLNGSPVVRGYVTVRWRSTNLIVLRADAACTEAPDKSIRCHPRRYTSMYVYDSQVPQACNVTFIERAYWPNWQQSRMPIHVKATRTR